MKSLALLAITTLAAAVVTNKAMRCQYVNLASNTDIYICLRVLSCITHGWFRNIEDTSKACQKRARRGVQGIYENGYCYVDAEETATFVNVSFSFSL
ncbi:hypothetical protein CSHISOI_11671 [Colletotrichum shisoi]|uniref:Uncharacterized protein n=1 Tax=Colletotrichum shisoi TaxID=2078593 RepID=A0A5Q4BA24_9PEZI|nr:hypothetical protein CSHISOI_11671 [Colletotrichum shisoi]